MSSLLSGRHAQEPWIESSILQCLEGSSNSASRIPIKRTLPRCVIGQLVDMMVQSNNKRKNGKRDAPVENNGIVDNVDGNDKYHDTDADADDILFLQVSDGQHLIWATMSPSAQHKFVQQQRISGGTTTRGCIVRLILWQVCTQQQALEQRQCDLQRWKGQNQQSQHLMLWRQQSSPQFHLGRRLCLYVEGSIDIIGAHGLGTVKDPMDIECSTKVKQWLLEYDHDWGKIRRQFQLYTSSLEGAESTSTLPRRNTQGDVFQPPDATAAVMGDISKVLQDRKLLKAISSKMSAVKLNLGLDGNSTALPNNRRQQHQQHHRNKNSNEYDRSTERVMNDNLVNAFDSDKYPYKRGREHYEEENMNVVPLRKQQQEHHEQYLNKTSSMNNTRESRRKSRLVFNAPSSKRHEPSYLEMTMLASQELVESDENPVDEQEEHDEDMGIDSMLVSQPPDILIEENRAATMNTTGQRSGTSPCPSPVTFNRSISSQVQKLGTEEVEHRRRRKQHRYQEEYPAPAASSRIDSFGRIDRLLTGYSLEEPPQSVSDETESDMFEEEHLKDTVNTNATTNMSQVELHDTQPFAVNTDDGTTPLFDTQPIPLEADGASNTQILESSDVGPYKSLYDPDEIPTHQVSEDCGYPRSFSREKAIPASPIPLEDANDNEIQVAYEEAERASPAVIRTPKRTISKMGCGTNSRTQRKALKLPQPPNLMVTGMVLLEPRQPSPIPTTVAPPRTSQLVEEDYENFFDPSSTSPHSPNAEPQEASQTDFHPLPLSSQQTDGLCNLDIAFNEMATGSVISDEKKGNQGEEEINPTKIGKSEMLFSSGSVGSSQAEGEEEQDWENHSNSLIEQTFRPFSQEQHAQEHERQKLISQQSIPSNSELSDEFEYRPAGERLRNFLYANSIA